MKEKIIIINDIIINLLKNSWVNMKTRFSWSWRVKFLCTADVILRLLFLFLNSHFVLIFIPNMEEKDEGK